MCKMWLDFLVSWVNLPFSARSPKVEKTDRCGYDVHAQRVENASARFRNGNPARGGCPYGLWEEGRGSYDRPR